MSALESKADRADGATPLIEAAKVGDDALVLELLEQGADLNAEDVVRTAVQAQAASPLSLQHER